ncbi:MAG: RNA-binding domain-containing protein [Candidatus Paceibacterota bacterium]|jgi:hypothetical protein
MSVDDFKNVEEDRLKGFLKYPLETKNVDYKSGEAISSKNPFSYKLIKHILGFANTGGGYIVIGYQEDGNKIPQPQDISKEVLASYDPSSLAQMAESFTSGEKVNLEIHKVLNSENQKIYPIIKVSGFSEKPFFCKKEYRDPVSKDTILKTNALYVRVSSSRTIELASPEDWNDLIDQCVGKRQEAFLFRFKDLMKEVGFMDLKKITKKNEDLEDNVENSNQNKVKKELVQKKMEFAGLEVFHELPNNSKKWNRKELIDSAEKSQQPNTGWPIGVMLRHNKEGMPKPTENGIELKLADGSNKTYDYWSLNETGTFYFFRNFQEDEINDSEKKRKLFFDTRIWRVIEAIKHAVSLYKALGVSPTEKILLKIKHAGINNRELTAGNPMRMMWHHISGDLKEVSWEKAVSFDDLLVNGEEFTKEIVRELFLMFEYWVPEDSVLDGVIEEYNKSKVR